MSLKAVIPAAGFGTRMLPAAKAVPKEMLPVLGKPVIQYVVEECVAAGASDVLLVTSREKKAIEDHFDRAPELEQRLEKANKLSYLGNLLELRGKVNIHSVRQQEQLGLGHAVLQAEHHVGENPFLCLLGDTIFTGHGPAAQLAAAWAVHGGTIIGLERVPREKVSRYGVIAGREISKGTWKVTDLVEKPKAEEAPSDLAIAARYLMAPEIFDHLKAIKPGAGGELQLTDALRMLAREGEVYGVVLEGTRHDIGSPEDWLATNFKFAREDAAMWAKLEPVIRSVMK